MELASLVAGSEESIVRRRPVWVLAVAALVLVTAVVPAHASPPWPQFGRDPGHSQVAAADATVTPQNVNTLQRLFSTTLSDVADGSPVYASGVSTASGVRNLLFVTTHNGTTVALDADSGSIVWSMQVGPGSCKINNGSTACYTTAAPAIDPSGQYVYAYGLDGKAHKYVAGTGSEITTGGWPETTTIKGFDEKGSGDLAVATAANGTSYLYVPNGGYPGDGGDYQGHVTTINLTTGAQTVFNTQCSDQPVHFAEKPATPDCAQVQSAVWARPGVVYDPTLDRIFFVTGNATYAPASHDWGDTVIALSPDGSGQPLDSWTPPNFQHLQDTDEDLGSTAPTLLPKVSGSAFDHLAVQGGKDAQLHLLDLADLSGQGGPGHTGGELADVNVPQGGQVLTQPLAWTDPSTGTTWVIVVTGSGISGERLTADATGKPVLTTAWKTTASGFSPVLSNGVVFYVTGGGLVALDARTGNRLWTNGINGGVHWNSAIVIGSTVYYTDASNHVAAYRLPTGPNSVSAGQQLTAGQAVSSTSGQYQLVMQSDGNLVKYGNGRALWSSGTQGHAGAGLTVQTDGNAVIYSASGQPLWATGTVGAGTANSLLIQDDGNLVLYGPNGAVWAGGRAGADTLSVGGRLSGGQTLLSADERHLLLMQNDGNLVIYGPHGAVWGSGTARTGVGLPDLPTTVFQSDGNVVYYPAPGQPGLWSSGTPGRGSIALVMQNDGNLVLYDASRAIWASGTAGR
ncbi:MAG: PQQ-binding-like beta-propeller repeat protein [Actinobacteria bacterium]|nr:PQQ-binding-like beta-propeller repeat protein [Actinomycetota bacterium]